MTARVKRPLSPTFNHVLQRALIVAPFLSMAIGLGSCGLALASDHAILGALECVAGLWLGVRALPLASLAEARVAFRVQNDADWHALGKNAAARERAIVQLFEAKTESVAVSVLVPHDPGCVVFRIRRHLSVMHTREREGLRAAYRLYDSGVIGRESFDYFRFAFIFGDGKAILEDWHTGGFDKPRDSHFGQALPGTHCRAEHATVAQALSRIAGLLQNGAAGEALIDELNRRFHGGGAWLAPNEVPATPFARSSAHALRLGVFENTQTRLEFSGSGGLITIAPSGAGKTQCFVIPNLLEWRGSALVLDVKGDAYAATAAWRARHVGPVYRLDPSDLARSHTYNPLACVGAKPEQLWTDAQELAKLMMPATRGEPFYTSRARDVLVAAVGYVCSRNAPAARSFKQVHTVFSGSDWDEWVRSLINQTELMPLRQLGRSFEHMKRKTRDSVLRTAQSYVSDWQGERIEKLCARADWTPSELRTSAATIYLCISPRDLEQLAPLVRVILAQHLQLLTAAAPGTSETEATLVMLDELPRLRDVAVGEALGKAASSGLRLWLFAQHLTQLRAADADAEQLLERATVRTFMNVQHDDPLAQWLSDRVGHREDPRDATPIKLVEPRELSGPRYRDLILVLGRDTKPAKLRKRYAFDEQALIAKRNFDLASA
jgi:type IV secretion system protein VirD4